MCSMTAAIIGAIVAGGASVYTAKQQSKAAEAATRAQLEAQNQALQKQQESARLQQEALDRQTQAYQAAADKQAQSMQAMIAAQERSSKQMLEASKQQSAQASAPREVASDVTAAVEANRRRVAKAQGQSSMITGAGSSYQTGATKSLLGS